MMKFYCTVVQCESPLILSMVLCGYLFRYFRLGRSIDRALNLWLCRVIL